MPPPVSTGTTNATDDLPVTVFNLTRVGLCVIDDAGRFVRVNPAFCMMTGCHSDQVLGQTFSAWIVPAVDIDGTGWLEGLAGATRTIPETASIRHRDGHLAPALVACQVGAAAPGHRQFILSLTALGERRQSPEPGQDRRALRAEQGRRHRGVLLALAQLDKSDFNPALARILGDAARTLACDSVAYWSFDADASGITCEMVHRAALGTADPAGHGRRFAATDFPAYFAWLASNRPVIAHRVEREPVLAEFLDGYLVPAGITSMIDVGVWHQGRMVGLVCHNHVGPARDWTPEEVDFATAISHMVSLALEAAQRQRLVDALARSEEKYRLVVENANEGILVAQDGKIKLANRKTLELVGRDLATVTTTPFLEFIHPADRPRVLDNHLRRMRGETVENDYSFRIVDLAGRTRWLQIAAVALDWEGRPATLNFLADVTGLKQLEDDLQSALTEQETILQTAMVGIVFLVERTARWLNHRFEQMFGYAPGELVGADSRVLYANPDDWDMVGREAYPQLSRGDMFETELAMRRKDGSTLWCFICGRAVDPGKLERGAIWVVLDISEQKRLQENLNHTLGEREAILRSTLVGITFSRHRRHEWVNETFARMLDYTPDALIGQSSAIHFPDPETWEGFGRQAYPVLAEGRPYATECQLRRRDGTLIWCEVYGQAVDPADLGRGTIWTFNEITERKRAEEDVRNALLKERELSELKSRFVAMTSHEFRTPLATIMSSVELLDDYADRLPNDEKSELMALIKSAVKRMTVMLDQILFIGRADAKRLEFAPGPVDVARLCEDVVDEVGRGRHGDHRIALEKRGQHFRRLVDEKLLRHILVNLLENACKYTPSEAGVGLCVDCDGEAVEFAVRDEGIGIPPEDQAHLFETFHRGRNVGTVSGTGLGLAIVKQSVNLHGGTIALVSAVDRGSTFTVRIPAAQV